MGYKRSLICFEILNGISIFFKLPKARDRITELLVSNHRPFASFRHALFDLEGNVRRLQTWPNRLAQENVVGPASCV